MASTCVSLNVPAVGVPRCPEVPKETRCPGSAGSGVTWWYAASRPATSINIDASGRVPAWGLRAVMAAPPVSGSRSRVDTIWTRRFSSRDHCSGPARRMGGTTARPERVLRPTRPGARVVGSPASRTACPRAFLAPSCGTPGGSCVVVVLDNQAARGARRHPARRIRSNAPNSGLRPREAWCKDDLVAAGLYASNYVLSLSLLTKEGNHQTRPPSKAARLRTRQSPG